MTESEIMEHVGSAYLVLVRPYWPDADMQANIERILEISSKVGYKSVSNLISNGESWRERLVGLVLAVGSDLASFIGSMVDSLRDPREFVIVPVFAALAVVVSEQPNLMPNDLDLLNRDAFSGELGWSVDHFLFYTGQIESAPREASPNDGHNFETHIKLIKMIRSMR